MRVPRQGWVLGLAAPLWALFGGPDLASALFAYLAALVVVGLVARFRPRALELRLPPLGLGLVAVAVVGPALGAAVERAPTLAENEGLLGVAEHLGDRWAMERTPAIAPGVVFTDRPQRFFVHAPGASAVSVEGAGFDAPLDAEALGHGLFRVDHHPRRDGALTAAALTIRTGEATARRPVERVVPTAHPRRLRTNPSRTLAAAVSEETDTLLVVDAEGFVASHDTADRPIDLAFIEGPGANGIAVLSADQVAMMSARSGETQMAHPLAHGTAIAAGNDAPIVPSGSGTSLVMGVGGEDPGLLLLVESGTERLADLPEGPDEIVCTWIACVASLRRTASLVVLGRERVEVPLGRPAVAMAAVDGDTVLVAVTDYSPGEPHLGNHFVQDQLLTLDLRTATITERQPTAWRSPRQAAAGDVDRGLSPMAIDAHGETLAVAFAGSDEIEVFRSGAPVPAVVDLADTPLLAPQGVARLADGTLLVSSPLAGAIGLFVRGELRKLVQLEDVDARTSAQALRLRGEHSFYEATRSGVACQSCHLHADTDHVMRNIGGRRLAPTLTVRGVAGTAPYLRDGSYPRIADLTHLSTTLLGGWLRHEAGRGEALDAFVRALPRHPPKDPPLERVREGLDVFVRAGCPTCHAFPAFTSLASVPQGSLFPESDTLASDERLDVPSLLSVGTRGPFLADGRAPTLRSVFDEAGGRHGDTESLAEEDLDALVTFLESL
ncbi:MAG: hypothetical protein JJ863_38165 [Deltaproteobacteria bacterium]|nr:hypothetical protein [Deltaproteobacteria bacterium]